jgi:hypothetical protein
MKTRVIVARWKVDSVAGIRPGRLADTLQQQCAGGGPAARMEMSLVRDEVANEVGKNSEQRQTGDPVSGEDPEIASFKRM